WSTSERCWQPPREPIRNRAPRFCRPFGQEIWPNRGFHSTLGGTVPHLNKLRLTCVFMRGSRRQPSEFIGSHSGEVRVQAKGIGHGLARSYQRRTADAVGAQAAYVSDHVWHRMGNSFYRSDGGGRRGTAQRTGSAGEDSGQR